MLCLLESLNPQIIPGYNVILTGLLAGVLVVHLRERAHADHILTMNNVRKVYLYLQNEMLVQCNVIYKSALRYYFLVLYVHYPLLLLEET